MLTSLRLILVFMHVPPPHRNCTIRTDTAHGEEHGSLGTSFKRTRGLFIIRLMFSAVTLFYDQSTF